MSRPRITSRKFVDETLITNSFQTLTTKFPADSIWNFVCSPFFMGFFEQGT